MAKIKGVHDHYLTSAGFGIIGVLILEQLEPSNLNLVLQIIVSLVSLLPAYWNFKKNKNEKNNEKS